MKFHAKSMTFSLFLMSCVINVLVMTSPIFMLQVYDRVLASGSVPTLLGLSLLAIILYLFQFVLDTTRSRLLLRMGELFDNAYSKKVYTAIVRRPLSSRMTGDGLQPLRDLDNVRGFFAGPGPAAIFDLPWMPFYLAVCFLFNFWIGVTATVGTFLLISLSILNSFLSKKPIQETITKNIARNNLVDSARRNAEIIRAMGLEARFRDQWIKSNLGYIEENRKVGDVVGGIGILSKTIRIVLQSAILAVGAWLVVDRQVTAGVMIASSIMMGRALAPIEQAVASWKSVQMAFQSWKKLKASTADIELNTELTALPPPTSELRLDGIVVVPPGENRPSVLGVNFAVCAGSAVGVVGASGSGKSTLSRVIVGAWKPAAGEVRMDGANIKHWDPHALGEHVGYLPQGIELFSGTIADNISRFEENPDESAIIEAAKISGAHEMILQFENGYQTNIGEAGSALSAGQRQRVGLARALYKDPFLVVLDEPNANLDAEGEAAVVRAIFSIRNRGGIVIVVAHRPSAISAVDYVLMMENGRQKAFGPRDEVLSKVLQLPNASRVAQQSQGGPQFKLVSKQDLHITEENNTSEIPSERH
jgi:ATP-binding cassette subfamily C protein